MGGKFVVLDVSNGRRTEHPVRRPKVKVESGRWEGALIVMSRAGNMSMVDDEMQTATSYYVLYAELAASTEQQQQQQQQQQGENEDEDGREVWAEDDDWTEERMEHARTALAGNEALCDVASSSIKGSYIV